MLNPTAFANAAPAGVAVLETVPQTEGARGLAVVPLRRTTVNGRWDGPLAEITVTHTYGYTQAQCDAVLEAIYRFPLPGNAAVRSVVVTFGEVEIAAELMERGQAEETYERAKREGRQATLTTQGAPDVFTLRIAGLQPDQDIVVETTYVQLADPDGIGWSLRIPLTTAPRYSRTDEWEGDGNQAQPLAVFRDPGHRFALDLNTGAAGRITSPTHPLREDDEDGHRRVRLADGELLPDRDCVLRWHPVQRPDRPTLWALTAADRDGGHTYLAALVAPPARPQESAPAREATILVDHSGSMGGAKWEAADRAALGFLKDLSPRDRFSIGVFHTSTRWLANAPLPANRAALESAERFLKAAPDGGGTNLGVALEQALSQARTPGDLSRQIVIITDAQVTDEARILHLMEADAQRNDRRRVSVLCIDSAPNAHLTRQMALRGGGIARFLTSDPTAGDMAAALQAILDGWSRPVAIDLKLAINRDMFEVAEGTVEPVAAGWSALDLGDLTMGRSLWVVGRVAGADPSDLELRLTGRPLDEIRSGATENASLPVDALKALFGASRVQGLERLLTAHLSEEELAEELSQLGYGLADLAPEGGGQSSLYPENAARTTHESLRALLVREALAYGLLCSATGFVAVRKERGRLVEETTLVANALPAGWSVGEAEAQPGLCAISRLAAPSDLEPAVHSLRPSEPTADERVLLNGRVSDAEPYTSLALAMGLLRSALAAAQLLSEYGSLLGQLQERERLERMVSKLQHLCERMERTLSSAPPSLGESLRALEMASREHERAFSVLERARDAIRAQITADLQQAGDLIAQLRQRGGGIGRARLFRAERDLRTALNALQRAAAACQRGDLAQLEHVGIPEAIEALERFSRGVGAQTS